VSLSESLGDPLLEAHPPTDACYSVHCHACGVDEPGTGYLACGECGHLYRRRSDLRRRWRQELTCFYRDETDGSWRQRLGYWWRWLTVRADRVTFCQECGHDF